MENIKLFNNNDLFFIAEKLDAIKFSLPIPPHTIDEFHDEDLYIIWTKLSGSAGITPVYGQVFASTQQTVIAPNPVSWDGVQNNSGVSVVGTDISFSQAGVYEIDWSVIVRVVPD